MATYWLSRKHHATLDYITRNFILFSVLLIVVMLPKVQIQRYVVSYFFYVAEFPITRMFRVQDSTLS